MEDRMQDTDREQDLMFEEICLSMQATDIIRKSRHLLRLHRLRTSGDQAPPRPEAKRARQELSPVQAEDMRRRVLWVLEQERMFLNEDLSLASFAHAMGIEPYQLSRFLNTCLHTTFTRLVNSCRVREAQDMLAKGGMTVLAIAFASGFNSKASFNRIFKRHTGKTPTEYRMKAGRGSRPVQARSMQGGGGSPPGAVRDS
ncbi:MAG TPA: AraC family transcriptional regulator [Deltaproteobacteria bacterium]|nr:AraC family transcriptional regulator [Deltaproteobacteria bacterium]HOI05621.1 AraC family transcriptional regulator [Deltaproteobacteria bacterium]